MTKFNKEKTIIINNIESRINDICERFKNGLYNEATMFAFWVGIGEDLESALNKIEKRKNGRRKTNKHSNS